MTTDPGEQLAGQSLLHPRKIGHRSGTRFRTHRPHRPHRRAPGTLEVTSPIGQGTAVHITLPIENGLNAASAVHYGGHPDPGPSIAEAPASSAAHRGTRLVQICDRLVHDEHLPPQGLPRGTSETDHLVCGFCGFGRPLDFVMIECVELVLHAVRLGVASLCPIHLQRFPPTPCGPSRIGWRCVSRRLPWAANAVWL
jgi:hypothetical protein